MKRALVIKNIVDMRSEANYRSERKSQALFGEALTVRETSGDFTLVSQADGYSGWVSTSALTSLGNGDWKKLSDAYTLRVANPVATVLDKQGEAVPPYFLSYGSIVYPAEESSNGSDHLEITSPDGVCRWLNRADLTPEPRPDDYSSDELQHEIVLAAVQFLGTPYLWGGRSALGFDCSGFVQLVYGMCAVSLPRDSVEQTTVGAEVPREKLAPADLIFFPGHVAIYLEAGRFIHASQSGGGVQINSFDKKAVNYRPDLDQDYLISRRPWENV